MVKVNNKGAETNAQSYSKVIKQYHKHFSRSSIQYIATQNLLKKVNGKFCVRAK